MHCVIFTREDQVKTDDNVSQMITAEDQVELIKTEDHDAMCDITWRGLNGSTGKRGP